MVVLVILGRTMVQYDLREQLQVVYGRKPPPLILFSQGETKVEAVEFKLVDRDEALRRLKHHLLKAQQQMKKIC